MMKRTMNGWHVLAIFAGCFSIIIAVNLTLAFKAVSTFPGLVSKNSYVSSQKFDADRTAQDALGWTIETTLADDRLIVAITSEEGLPVRPQEVKATLGRATHVAEDLIPAFEWNGTALVAEAVVPAGYWTLWLEMTAEDGTPFRRRIPLTAEEAAS